MENFLKQNPGFEFLNLEGACPAEKEILQSIIRNTLNSKGLFCFETPFSVEETDRSVHAEFGQGEGVIIVDPVAGDNATVPTPVVTAEADATGLLPEPGNGTMLAMSSHQHVNPPTVTSHAMPAFYPGQPPIAVAVSGAGGHVPSMGPNSVHNPVSGNQMMMFAQPMSQMIQTHAGFFPSHYYAPPPTGAQSHMQFVGQTSESMSPDANYLPPGQMSHLKHDSHHSSHPATNTNQGMQTPYGKNRRKQQPPQQQQSYYYTTAAPFYGNMQFYNQQLAQNVTGPPIIMAGPAGMFQYPHQHQTHHGVYNQGPSGNDMEHHPGSLPHAVGPIANEMTFAQHHPSGPNNPHVYSHNSPTHSNPRTAYGSLNNTPPARNAHSISDHTTSSGDSIVENGSPSSSNENDAVLIASSTSTVELPNASKVFNGTESSQVDETLSSSTNRDNIKVDTGMPSKSSISEASIVHNGELERPGLTRTDDNIVVPESIHSQEGVSNTKIDTPLQSSNVLMKDLDSVQTVDVSSGAAANVKVEYSSANPTLVNGGVDTSNDSNSDKLSTKCRDISADLETSSLKEGDKDAKVVSGSKQSCDAKPKGQTVVSSKSSNKSQNFEISSVRAANGGSNNVVKLVDEGNAGEFPNLNETAAVTISSEVRKAPEPSYTKTWASIASVKTPNIPIDGATAFRSSQSSLTGGSSSINNHDSYYKASDQFVPMQHDERSDSFDTSLLSDENDPVAIRLGEHLQKYNLDHRSIPLSPRGLCNQSNYCFLNATLQALLACPTFVNLFQSLTPILSRAPCKATPIIQNVFSFVNEFQPVTRGSNQRKDRMRDSLNVGASFEPTGIRKCLGLLEGETFKVEGRQEDAEEFLSHLLNGLHDEMIKVIKWSECKKERTERGLQPYIPEAVNGTGSEVNMEINEDEEDDQWQVMGARNKSCVTRKTAITKSPISEAFLGQMCSSLSRANAIKSATLQPFYTLQLDIQNENIRSVRDALESISTKEEVSGVTSSTGSEVEAWRTLSLEDLPPVLILHLKRFVYEKNGNRIHKIDKKLDFGVDLEIGKELLSNNGKKFTLKQRQYKLFAVVYHDGEEAHKGHYVADCFHPLAGTQWGQWGWLRYDDTSVKQISEAYMLNPQPPRVPYLLYYRRQDTIQLLTKKERSS